MKIENLIGGRIFKPENDREVELMQRFSKALAEYDLKSTPSYKRRKLQALWLKVEYASGQTLAMSMGVKRNEVFECETYED